MARVRFKTAVDSPAGGCEGAEDRSTEAPPAAGSGHGSVRARLARSRPPQLVLALVVVTLLLALPTGLFLGGARTPLLTPPSPGHAGGSVTAPIGAGDRVSAKVSVPPPRSGPGAPGITLGSEEPRSYATTAAGAALLRHTTTVTPLVAGPSTLPSAPSSAAWLAYAPWDYSFYVAAPPSSVDVVNATNHSVTSVISVGQDPFGVAVDPRTKEVFVTNKGSGNVSVIDGTTQKVVTSVTVQKEPQGIAYDATNRTVYVADNGTNNVSVISVASLSVAWTISVGRLPLGVAWDNATNRIFVTDAGSRAVTIIAPPYSVVGTVSVGSTPYGLAIDNRTDNVYVANRLSNNVSVISAKTGALNATIPVLADFIFGTDLQGVGYDYAHDIVWVAAGVTAVAIQPSSALVVAYIFYDPSGVAYDPVNHDVCVTNTYNRTFSCFVYGTAGVTIPEAALSIHETGLPNGTTWNVTLWPWARGPSAVTTSSKLPWQSLGIDKGQWSHSYWYNFTAGSQRAGSGAIYTPNPSVGCVQYNWSTTTTCVGWVYSQTSLNVQLNLTYSTTLTYPVNFTESGLPAGLSWNVTVNGVQNTSTGSLVGFREPNGSYTYQIGSILGWSPSPGGGTVSVNGAAASVAVTWHRTFPVQFHEYGLPNGTSWAAYLGGQTVVVSATPTISFAVANGTYNYTIQSVTGWTAVPASGFVTVSGALVSVTVRWAQIVTYAVTFTETGLPQGYAWNVSLGGVGRSSTTPSLTFTEPNGSYAYTIAPLTLYGLTEYAPSPSSGSAIVSAAAVSVTITYRLEPWFYRIVFNETGLTIGADWSVALAGQGASATASQITFLEPNGSYTYTAGGPTGFFSTPSSGRVTVQGAAVTVQLVFGLIAGLYLVSFNETGLGTGTVWSVNMSAQTLSSSGSSIGFGVQNGTYSYVIEPVTGYVVSPTRGTVSVTGVAAAVILVQFTSTSLYSVTFRETGLPTGTGWAVSIGSQLESSVTNSMTLLERNGTYGYVVLPVTGFTTASSGFLVVAAADISVTIAFHPQTYPVVVLEFGLPSGTTWSVSVSNRSTGFNQTFATNATALIFYVPNGTYALRVSAAGYNATLSSPTFTVLGRVLGTSPTAQFTGPGTPGKLNPANGGLPAYLWFAFGALAAVLLVGSIGAIAWERRRRRDEGEQWIAELTRRDDDDGGSAEHPAP